MYEHPYAPFFRRLAEVGEKVRRDLRLSLERINENLRVARNNRRLLIMREQDSEQRYRAAVRRERTLGLAHVRVEADRVCRELGLPPLRR